MLIKNIIEVSAGYAAQKLVKNLSKAVVEYNSKDIVYKVGITAVRGLVAVWTTGATAIMLDRIESTCERIEQGGRKWRK